MKNTHFYLNHWGHFTLNKHFLYKDVYKEPYHFVSKSINGKKEAKEDGKKKVDEAVHYISKEMPGLNRTVENNVKIKPDENKFIIEKNIQDVSTNVNSKIKQLLSKLNEKNKNLLIINYLLKSIDNLDNTDLVTIQKRYQTLYNQISGNYDSDKIHDIVLGTIKIMIYYGEKILKNNDWERIEAFKIELLSLLTIKTRIPDQIFIKYAWKFMEQYNQKVISTGDIKKSSQLAIEQIENKNSSDDIFKNDVFNTQFEDFLKQYEYMIDEKIRIFKIDFNNGGLKQQQYRLNQLNSLLKTIEGIKANEVDYSLDENTVLAITDYFNKIINKINKNIVQYTEIYNKNTLKINNFLAKILKIINNNMDDSPKNWEIFTKVCAHIFKTDNFFSEEYLKDLVNNNSVTNIKQMLTKIKKTIKSFSDHELSDIYYDFKNPDVVILDEPSHMKNIVKSIPLRIELQSDFLYKLIDTMVAEI